MRNLATLPVTTKYLVVLLPCLLCFSFGFYFDIRKLQQHLTQATRQQVLLQQQLHNKQQQVKRMQQHSTQMAILKNTYTTYKSQLRQKITPTLLVNNMAKVAHSHRVQLIAIHPKPKETKTWLLLHPIQITISGNYQQLIAFMENLNQLPYLTALPDFSLSPVSNNPDNLMLNAMLIVYEKKLEDK